MAEAVMRTDLPLSDRREGKVRDTYRGRLRDGREAVVLVATDRVSAFDVVMPTPVPSKGVLLTAMAAWWFGRVAEASDRLDGLTHHVLTTDPADVEGLGEADAAALAGRLTAGRVCEVVPIECVVRGYLAGSGWKAYRATGEVCGVRLPDGLVESDRLPEPIFTPATKATSGHDQNIPFDRAAEIVGRALMERLADWSMRLYRLGAEVAEARGLILADTKFEFGLPVGQDGAVVKGAEPVLIDEALTMDSSRYWPAEGYRPGGPQPSFDKQFVRDYLQGLYDAGAWDKRAPGPELPDQVVAGTLERYREGWRRLTGSDWR
ncbi:MAG: phosphoribosylaminoimidazolesuccinocarboxamide synthase [Planctomycetota bacterium]